MYGLLATYCFCNPNPGIMLEAALFRSFGTGIYDYSQEFAEFYGYRISVRI